MRKEERKEREKLSTDGRTDSLTDSDQFSPDSPLGESQKFFPEQIIKIHLSHESLGLFHWTHLTAIFLVLSPDPGTRLDDPAAAD